MNPAELKAPAKINLYLKVRGRRPDGYHELDSVMARLALADGLRVEFGGAEDRLATVATLPCPLPPDFDGPDNLILAALRAFRGRCGGWPQMGVSVRLEKNIPLGAGLGGGSSDCAAILDFLNQWAPRPLSGEKLNELGKSLGADVPFFLQPRALARARGLGEQLADAPQAYSGWAGRAIIVVNPGLFVSTGKVFQTLGLTNPPSNNNLGPMSFPEPGENDLLGAAFTVAPELRDAAESVEALKPKHWGLSGSGATFWLMSGAPDRDLEDLKAARPTWWVRQTAIMAGD
jgi:4-diphosphocytidyl-2-C-methyl-D-erythritol kinase